MLLGTGRIPHTAGLDLAAVGVDVEAGGFIKVDDYQQTTASSIYAIGDVANPAMTSNHALAEAAVAVANIIAAKSRRRDDDAIPEVTYSALELARIGLNEDGAEAKGFEPATGFTAFGANPAALGEGDARGFVRRQRYGFRKLLGAEIVGRCGRTHPSAGTRFRQHDALKRLAGMAYNHPTRAEEILNATKRWRRSGGFAPGYSDDVAD